MTLIARPRRTVRESVAIGITGRDTPRALEDRLAATEQSLRDAEAALDEVEGLAGIGTWIWDIRTNELTWSQELARIHGVGPGCSPEAFADYLTFVHPDDTAATGATFRDAIARCGSFEVEYRIIVPGGELRSLLARGRVEAGEMDTPVRMIGVCRDLTEQARAEAELRRLALHDQLTGLANRALFLDRVDQGLARLARNHDGLAVLFIDLDRFKLINDSMGHAAGDEVLTTVAERIRAIVRPADTVARFGGDEFAILCEELTELEPVIDLAKRVLEVIAVPIAIANDQQAIAGASIGIVMTSAADTATEALLRDADAAMYEAKEAGRNRYVVFSNESRLGGLARLKQADELRSGLERDEFTVIYQPVMDLRGDTWVGVEALLRWKHPTLGLLGPDAFIGVAEDMGVIVPLGAWVMAEACRDLASMTGLTDASTFLAVNLSARQLAHAGLVDELERALGATGLAADRLCLEITESVLMDDVDHSLQALRSLKAIGVQIAVDDFGTGYSSLSYLRKLPIDVVKIDRSFVAGAGVNPADEAIVAAVVNLSHALGSLVVAEGVETQEQLVTVRALGCDQAQGFYWSRPVALEDLAAWGATVSPASVAREPVDLYSLLVERTDALRKATGRPVVLQAPPKLAAAAADLGGVKTILDHLLGNAITYSRPDRPVVVSAAADRSWVRVSVADFGVGMTTDESARCFEQFWQAPEASTRSATGTGMGLYVVRSLVEAMGGHVGVKSAKGKGSTFTFALPRSSRGAARRRPAAGLNRDVGEDSSIREFMRQIGVPTRRGS
jgi:diguanylate cyclase (GGDEF)-like protein